MRVNVYKPLYVKGNMLQRFFLMVLISFLLLGTVSASVETLGTFKQNDCVNLIQTCSNCSYNKVSSVIAPNSNQAIGLSDMEKTGNVYNLTFCSTSQIGTYIVNGYGDVDGLDTVWAYDFDITPSGNVNNPNFYYLIFIVSLGVMVLGFAVKNGWVAILGSFGLVYLGLYIILYGINGIKDTVYTWGFGIILLAVAGYIGIKSAFEMIGDIE